MPNQNAGDQDAGKGATEGDGRGPTEREQAGNVSMAGQNPHRTQSRLVKDNDSDFPEPGGSPEHSGQQSSRENKRLDEDPKHRQKKNRTGKKDDPRAA